MPNAAATFDDDFGFDKPARKTAPRKSRTASVKKKKRPGYRLNMRKIARVTAIGLSGTLVVGIVINALVLQKSRHPAPLFGKTVALAPSSASAVVTATAPAPSEAAAAATMAPEPVAAPASIVPVSKPRHATADKAIEGDAIARLLQGSGAVPSNQADKPGSKTILDAQRALTKLGFAVKPNGSLGPATRKAIEAFEKDRHLPMKGELTRRLVKIIGAESGVKID